MHSRKKLGSLVVMVNLLMVACTTGELSVTETSEVTSLDQARVPVVVDYSPTVSDVGGLLYLLKHPSVDVLAITLPGTGEAGCRLGVEVTVRILAMVGAEGIPVACDPEIPEGTNQWDPAFLSGRQNLLADLPDPTSAAVDESPSALIARTVLRSEAPVVIYAVAPLTNIASALREHPELSDNIAQIVVMGGAVDVAGNVEGSDAEWNLWIDPAAAASVISSGVPVTLVPLDATNDVPVPGWYAEGLAASNQTPAIEYLGGLVEFFPFVTSGGFYFWDELAATVAAGESFVVTEPMSLYIASNGADQGVTRSGGESPVVVATGVTDPNAFYSGFLSILSEEQITFGSATAAETNYFTALEDAFIQFATAADRFFSDPAFDEEEPFDPEALANGIAELFDALEAGRLVMVTLRPPASLAESHDEFLDVLGTLATSAPVILDNIRSSTSIDEAFGQLGDIDLSVGCETLQAKAGLRGLEVLLPCG